ncbi:MAG TPA: NAD(P)/FAD-dependent oxidoreductase [Mycobacterium sp.]|jgi:phytoene dehydrogenase-like protein
MDVTVVGSGPNGLAAAVVCARAGLSVQVLEAQSTPGGGTRTLPDPEYAGVRHDVCSAVHPLAVGSPFFAAFDLAARGVKLAVPDISYANPFVDRPAAIAYRDLDRTSEGLDDGKSWRRLLEPMVKRADAVVDLLLGDKRSLPTDLGTTLRLALRMAWQGTPAWNATFTGRDAEALFSGVAAHTISPLPSITSAAAGMLLASLAHSVGWPIPVGGSQAIADALIADLRAHSGELHTDAEVTEPPGGAVLFDTAPTALLDIYGAQLPASYAKRLRRYRFGSGVAKVDFVLSDDVPWSDPRLAEAVTFHLGGDRADMAQAEADVAAGRHADRPMMLAALPYVVDAGRVDASGRRPFWTYAHVPAGSTIDQAETVTAVVESFAPGFRDVVVATRSVPAAHMTGHNANYVGGDIAVGGNNAWRALAGPVPQLNPWATPLPGVYLCSSATPPGAGVHGMSGYYAARTMLKREFGITQLPSLAP